MSVAEKCASRNAHLDRKETLVNSWVRLLLALVLTLLLSFGTNIVTASKQTKVEARPAPTVPSFSYYVNIDDVDWGATITYRGASRLRAYKFGYEYTPGTWNLTILAFGRQTTQIVNGKLVWGVDLIGTRPNAGFKANDWVVKVAQAFIDGYLDGHPSGHPNTIGFDIAIGTSNANHEPPNAPNGGNGTGWVCDNQTNRVDSRYTTAGQQWAMNVINKITAPPVIGIRSAVDWESWDDNYPDGWIACGQGAVKWIEQYDTKTDVMNINFGNNAHTTDPSQWTPQQVHTISFGNPRAFVAPQIYCNGQINPWVSLNDVDRINFLELPQIMLRVIFVVQPHYRGATPGMG
jgi:hypothetical protein